MPMAQGPGVHESTDFLRFEEHHFLPGVAPGTGRRRAPVEWWGPMNIIMPTLHQCASITYYGQWLVKNAWKRAEKCGSIARNEGFDRAS